MTARQVPVRAVKAWAVLDSTGRLDGDYIAATEEQARELMPFVWSHTGALGYRIIRVTITPETKP